MSLDTCVLQIGAEGLGQGEEGRALGSSPTGPEGRGSSPSPGLGVLVRDTRVLPAPTGLPHEARKQGEVCAQLAPEHAEVSGAAALRRATSATVQPLGLHPAMAERRPGQAHPSPTRVPPGPGKPPLPADSSESLCPSRHQGLSQPRCRGPVQGSRHQERCQHQAPTAGTNPPTPPSSLEQLTPSTCPLRAHTGSRALMGMKSHPDRTNRPSSARDVIGHLVAGISDR